MFNLYLDARSFVGATIANIERSLAELNEIVTTGDDAEKFWKDSNSLFAVNIRGGDSLGQVIWTDMNPQFSATILPRLFHRIGETGREYLSIADFERDHPIFGAFYGITFPMSHPRHICDKNAYDQFRDDCFDHELQPEQFRRLANVFLPNLIFSENAFEKILTIADSKLFADIIYALRQLDSSNVEGWKRGYYDHKSLPVEISGESESTMKDPRLSRLRDFAFPDGKERRCELHIKINRKVYRIHIFPENHKIYVGYIGKHLPTSSS